LGSYHICRFQSGRQAAKLRVLCEADAIAEHIYIALNGQVAAYTVSSASYLLGAKNAFPEIQSTDQEGSHKKLFCKTELGNMLLGAGY